jgi:hypothetical protein
VRRKGETSWIIQPDQITVASPNGHAWGIRDAVFGSASDAGQVFEVAAIVSREPIPSGPTPGDLVSRELIAWSDLVYVVKTKGVSVSISSVDGIRVLGDAVFRAFDESPVGVTSRHLPEGALIGIAVEPIYPERTKGGAHWVMDNAISEAEGVIATAFGDPCKHLFFEFQVSAFAAFPDEFPLRGSALDNNKWEGYEKNFIAESRPVRAVKWAKDFQILSVGPNVTGEQHLCSAPGGEFDLGGGTVFTVGAMIQSERADIRGSVNRPLADGEAIHVVCIPDSGDAWSAGPTARLLPGGEWVIYAAQLLGPGQPRLFTVTAVISRAEPTRLDASSVREWLAVSEVSRNSVLVQFRPARAR